MPDRVRIKFLIYWGISKTSAILATAIAQRNPGKPCPTLDPQPVDVSQPLTSGLALFKLVALIACKIKPEENLWQRIK
jgi:hypothetical protein